MIRRAASESERGEFQRPCYIPLRGRRAQSPSHSSGPAIPIAFYAEISRLSCGITRLQITKQNRFVGRSDYRPGFIDHNRTAKDGVERIASNVSLKNRLPSGRNETHQACASRTRHDPACILHVQIIERPKERREVRVRNSRRTRRGCAKRRTKSSNVAAVAQRDPIGEPSVIPTSQLVLNPGIQIKLGILSNWLLIDTRPEVAVSVRLWKPATVGSVSVTAVASEISVKPFAVSFSVATSIGPPSASVERIDRIKQLAIALQSRWKVGSKPVGTRTLPPVIGPAIAPTPKSRCS